MQKLTLPILVLLLALSSTAMAQVTMDEVDVTAAMRRLSDTGLEQQRLDTALLHQNVTHSMADVLMKHSTLYVKSYGRATESTAEFRGTSPSHTQVLWNGIRLNSPMLGTMDLSYIPAYFVDEATLLSGASSLTATGGGLGGAIVMRTLPPAKEGWGLQYVQGAGSYTTFDEFVRLTYKGTHWSSSTRFSAATSDNDFHYTNYDKKVDVRDDDGNILSSYHPKELNKSGYFTDFNVMQDLAYDDHRGNLVTASVWYAHSLRGLPFLSVDYKDDSAFTNEHLQQTVNAALAWQHKAERWSTTLRAAYAFQDIAYDYTTNQDTLTSDITHSKSRSHTALLEAEAQYMPTDRWLLEAKASVNYTHAKSRDRSPFHIGENYDEGRADEAVSLTARWRVTPWLNLAAILREEVYGSDVIAPIPALFADYFFLRAKHVSMALKASIARNYRYPSMSDLYFQPGGNPDLDAEKGFTYDGGVELKAKGRIYDVDFNIAAFDSHIDDWILWTPNSKGYWQPSNVKRVHSYGFEYTAQASVRLPRQWGVSLHHTLAYTKSINKGERVNSNDASYGKQLCYVPELSTNLLATLSWRTWALSYSWTHYSERYTTTSNETSLITGTLKPYYMSDLHLEKKFSLRHLQASVRAIVNNLWDTHYVTVLSHPMAGRNYEFVLSLTPTW